MTAAALSVAVSSQDYYTISTRHAVTAGPVHTFDGADRGSAAAVANTARMIDVKGFTQTYTGTTDVTNTVGGFNLNLDAMTYVGPDTLALAVVSGIRLNLPVATASSGTFTMTDVAGIRIVEPATGTGTITTQTGIKFAQALDAGSTNIGIDMGNNSIENVGGSGNDWGSNTLTKYGSGDQNITVQSTSSESRIYMLGGVNATIRFRMQQGDGSGSDTNMQYQWLYDDPTTMLALSSTNTDGAGADTDIWRIQDGTDDVHFLGGIGVGIAAPTNALMVHAGSEATPSIRFSGNSTSGFYDEGSGAIGFSVSGSKVLELGTTGLLDVGASGNDWTASDLRLAGLLDADTVLSIDVPGAGNPIIKFGGNGLTARGNWYVGVNNAVVDYFTIGRVTTMGADVWIQIESREPNTTREMLVFSIGTNSRELASGNTQEFTAYNFDGVPIVYTGNTDMTSDLNWAEFEGPKFSSDITSGTFRMTGVVSTLMANAPFAGDRTVMTNTAAIQIQDGGTPGTSSEIVTQTGLRFDALSAGTTNIGIDLNGNTLENVGASGNDWTQYRLIIEEGRDGSIDLVVSNTTVGTAAVAVMKVATQYHATSGADPLIHWRIDGGTTQNWYAGIDNTDAAGRRFTIGTNLPGAADAIRITTAKAVSFDDENASYTTFSSDYVCGSCGKSGLKPFDCCGVVAWHDDVLALRELQLSPAGIQHMAKLGVYEIDGPDTGSPGEAFINFQKAMKYTWAGMWQNRERMDAQHQTIDERLKRIEQALGA